MPSENCAEFGRFFYHIGIQPGNEPGLFQHRNENGRREQPFFRIFPPGQGFHARDLAGQCTHHRLVVHFDVTLFQGFVKISKYIGPVRQLLAHGFVIH